MSETPPDKPGGPARPPDQGAAPRRRPPESQGQKAQPQAQRPQRPPGAPGRQGGPTPPKSGPAASGVHAQALGGLQAAQAPSPVRDRLSRLAAVAALAAAVWAGGFAWFVAGMPDRVADPDSETDAIVVLTGGAERLATGLRLLGQGLAERLFVSGVHRDVDVAELLRVSEQADQGLAGRIDIGHEARDTIGNAAETAAWMDSHTFNSLRLVTANYHLQRSLLEFRKAMPLADVIAHPVFPEEMRDGIWWARPKTLILVVGEYNKYLLARLRHANAVTLRPEEW